jgi:hypothetical protein
MNRKVTIALLFVALAFSLPALAISNAVVRPASPLAGQPFTIDIPIGCAELPYTVTRTGFTIVVQFIGGGCLPVQRVQSVPLGPLAAAGDYLILAYGITATPQDLLAREVVRVRNAGEDPFVVTPSAMPADAPSPAPVRIRTDAFLAEFCYGACKLLVAGKEVSLTWVQDHFQFTPPSGLRGAVDVTLVEPAGGTVTAREALYFFDRNAPPDLARMERILFPILFNAPGAHGSLWRSEVVISNPERWTIETYNTVTPIVCVAPPCGERLEPLSRTAFTGGHYPRGVALVAGRRDAQHLAFSLRIRDVSREAEGFGTEVPVVREAEMFRDVVTLLDVPVDPRYRVKLRIYSFDEQQNAGTLVAHDYARGTRTRTPFVLRRDCVSPAECAATPAYAEVDLPATGIDERVNLFVEMPRGSLAWAFASVTNNATQQVTLVTPNGRGGTPCTECESR